MKFKYIKIIHNIMKRQETGRVNAYILNLMVHFDTMRMDEYELRDRIEDRFRHPKKSKRIRPQNVRKFHIETLIERHWLKEIEGKYERIGELRHISPKMTLSDQFQGIPENYRDSFIKYAEEKRDSDYINTLTEEEYKDYIQKVYGN